MASQEKKKELLLRIESLLDSQDSVLLGALMQGLRPSDIAEVVELLDNEHRYTIFKSLSKDIAAEVLQKIDEAARAQVYQMLSPDEFAELVALMSSDEATDVLAELSEEDSGQVYKLLPPDIAADVKRLMKYSEDSAGGIMDPVLISVDNEATVAEAVEKIRSAEIDEDFYSVYVVDRDNKFLGDVRIRQLLTSHADTKVNSLLDADTICVNIDTDQEEVRNLFHKNDLIVAAVLDLEHKLVGRITADRIIEVAAEEANEDLYAMAGTGTAELEKESIVRAARIRMTWLFPCLVGTAVTAVVGMFFRETFHQNSQLYIWAAAFVFTPMVAAISGNAGLQTAAIVISGLAAGHLADLRLREVFEREFRIAILVAICCGILGAVACGFLPGLFQPASVGNINLQTHLRIVLAFGTGMFSSVMVSTTLGLFLPFMFRRIGIDPAISAGPLVTTANDSISVTIYMALTLLLI